MYDVIIAGGGPAGLSAALVLGRCRRRVLLCDTGRPRNAASQAMHGYLTRDGIPPRAFLEAARQEIDSYHVECRDVEVVAVRCLEQGFEITMASDETARSYLLLIATGVVDQLPSLPGFAEYYGRGIHHCPYCDGWEVRDQSLAVYGRGANAYALALSLLTWSPRVVLCSDGPARLNPGKRQQLAEFGIALREDRLARVEGNGDSLQRVVFRNDDSLDCDALFFTTSQRQHSGLAESLGCHFTRKGAVLTNRREGTNVAGLFVAGDASHDVQFVIVAAAEGAKAAVAMNKALQQRDRLLAW